MESKAGNRFAQLTPNCPEVLFADHVSSKTGLARIPLATYLKPKIFLSLKKPRAGS